MDEFVVVSGLHRKHAMRLLRTGTLGLTPMNRVDAYRMVQGGIGKCGVTGTGDGVSGSLDG